MIKDIVKDQKILKQISMPIASDENIDELIQDLKDTLCSMIPLHGGVAISAIQIGVPKRVTIYRLNDTKNLVFVNPIIDWHSSDNILHEEGCLSFPGVFIPTRRHAEIIVKDEGEYRKGIKLTGLASRALQHEIDHLDGVLMFEREYKKATQKPNEKCSCGSGKKYKKCCGKNI
jgi:peptide deformylase